MKSIKLAAILTIALAGPAAAAVVAEKQESPAKGTKSCAIQQIDSEYQDAKYAAAGAGAVRADPAPISVTVRKGGSVSINIIADTMPGTRVYFALGGHRYAGRSSAAVPVGPLQKEQLVQFTYTSWPENVDVNGEDVLSGFAAAYAECRAFMG